MFQYMSGAACKGKTVKMQFKVEVYFNLEFLITNINN